ncbi:MAG: nidogen-like domain-containing protein [Cyanobacteriota bacterium]|nr:nidogen-like domain-containing protein [Cyanobacteriota bacterium]
MAIVLGVTLGTASAQAAVPLLNGFGGPSGYGEAFLARNDDSSTGRLDLPFAINFFGTRYTSFWINNNGNITFTGALSGYTPNAFPGAQRPIIAPWWADVDTRNTGSDIVYYDAPNADTMVVTWPGVGYYNTRADKLNSFQLVLQRNPGDTSGAFTAQFRYAQLQWTTGSASGGVNGLGGTPAVAGYDAGNNRDYFMLPGSRTGAILDVVRQSNVSPDTPGLWQFDFTSSGQAPGTTPDNPLMPVIVDDSFVFQFPVQPNVPVFIDPPVTVGYDYRVTGGPLFNSVTAPTLANDNLYSLFFSNDACSTYSQFVTQLTGSVQFSFSSPQSCFSIRDIAEAANLSPTDPAAFVTGVTFSTAGLATVTQTPINVNVPGPLPVLGVGAALGWSRRLRSRVGLVKQS